MLLITSIHYPRAAAIFLMFAVVGRIVFAYGYRNNGPKGRRCGALIWDVALIGSFITAIMSLAVWNKHDSTGNEGILGPISSDTWNGFLAEKAEFSGEDLVYPIDVWWS